MNIVVWIVQALLALAFLAAGAPKASQPIPSLAKSLPWTQRVPAPLVRFIGVAELLGAIGIILPDALYGLGLWKSVVFPPLGVAAAIGLALVMVSAAVYHASQKEYSNIGFNAILLALAVFVIVGRVALAPIAA